jgi:hypothetical protein
MIFSKNRYPLFRIMLKMPASPSADGAKQTDLFGQSMVDWWRELVD